MKKTLVLILISLLSVPGFSQTEDEPGFQLGFQFSPSIGWFKPDSEGLERDGMRVGFNFGLTADFNISKNYAFSTGLGLINTGGKINFQDVKPIGSAGVLTGGRTTADIQLNYIHVPITLKLKTNQIGYMTYFARIGFGLGVNYRAEADEEFKYPGVSETISGSELDYKDEINLLRTSLIIGLGAEYNLSGNTSLVFGASFDNGFNNVLKEDAYEEDANGNGIIGPKDKAFKAIQNQIVLNLGIIF
tara:strand:+ start:12659 stop:13396 length:738 start_codon:yes stop_codon:yes gene_type:complete